MSLARLASLARSRNTIKILNPMPGGSAFTSVERAARFIRARKAYLDASNQLVFFGKRKAECRLDLEDIEVDHFSGTDARPLRAVLPPSPEVLARMMHHRGPLRPPLRPTQVDPLEAA